MMSASLKAGLIGGAIALVLSVVAGIIPCVGCITSVLMLLVYVGAGALAAFWLPAPRSAGPGAGAGAIAGVITSLVGGVVSMIVSAIFTSPSDLDCR